MTNIYYRHSGKMAAYSIPLVFGGGLIAMSVLALIYQFAVWYCPLIYVNLFITFGLGIGAALSASMLMKKAKVRNNFVISTTGALFAFYALYASWVIRIALTFEGSPVVLNPLEMLTAIQEISNYTVWTVRGAEISGIVAYIMWLIEFGIVGFVAIAASQDLKKQPFCEVTQTWSDETTKLGPLKFISDPAGLKAKVESGDFSALTEIPKVQASADRAICELHGFTKNPALKFYSIKNITVTIKDNEPKEDESYVIRNVVSDPETNALIEELWGNNAIIQGTGETLA